MKLPRKILNALYIVGGTLSLLLGLIGVILPILPTVPFFLLTAFLYAKGSKRFHLWFINSKLYHRYISGLAEHQTMSLAGELALLIFVSLMLTFVVLLFADNIVIAIVLPILDLLKYTYFVFKIKTLSRSELITLKQQLSFEASVINPAINPGEEHV